MYAQKGLEKLIIFVSLVSAMRTLVWRKWNAENKSNYQLKWLKLLHEIFSPNKKWKKIYIQPVWNSALTVEAGNTVAENKLRSHCLQSCKIESQAVLLILPKTVHPVIQFDFA
jgi:hypothetical protein